MGEVKSQNSKVKSKKAVLCQEDGCVSTISLLLKTMSIIFLIIKTDPDIRDDFLLFTF
jgi:hypothetical protein